MLYFVTLFFFLHLHPSPSFHPPSLSFSCLLIVNLVAEKKESFSLSFSFLLILLPLSFLLLSFPSFPSSFSSSSFRSMFAWLNIFLSYFSTNFLIFLGNFSEKVKPPCDGNGWRKGGRERERKEGRGGKEKKEAWKIPYYRYFVTLYF